MSEETLQKAYTYGGKVAHYLPTWQLRDVTSALCGHAPAWGTSWYGTGTQAERDKVRQMPVCKKCIKVNSGRHG